MGKPTYVIRKANQNGECLIQLYYRFNRKRLYYSTRRFVRPEDWDREKQRAKGRKSKSLNYFLDRLANEAESFYLRGEDHVTPNSMRAHLDEFTGRASSSKSLFGWIEKFIDDRLNDPRYAKSSAKVYRTAQRKLSEYCKEHRKGSKVDFGDMDRAFFKSYSAYLLSKNYSSSYIHKVITTLMTMLNEALRDGVTSNAAFKAVSLKDDLKINKKSSPKIYLTWDEIERIRKAEIENRSVDYARDMLIILCLTGQRYSDLDKLNADNVKEIKDEKGRNVQCFDITTKKTGTRVLIPIHPYLRPILDKYDWKPKVTANATLNRALKKVGEAVGLEKAPKITTHVGRYSFISNCSKMGLPMKVVMSIVGHRSKVVHEGYDKREKEEFAIALTTSQFFGGHLRKVK